MIVQDEEEIMNNINNVFSRDLLPLNFVWFLEKLSIDKKANFNVIYDIGSCVMHFYRHAHRLWPDAEIICFDAFSYLTPLYEKENVKFENVLLYDVDNLKIKFYENPLWYGGNSIYRENTHFFPPDGYIIKETITLDTLVENKKYPLPDLIKIDVQGAELDIIKGSRKCLENATHIILEIANEGIPEYNLGGVKQKELIEYLNSIGYIVLAPSFSTNPCDSDWCFINTKKVNYCQ